MASLRLVNATDSTESVIRPPCVAVSVRAPMMAAIVSAHAPIRYAAAETVRSAAGARKRPRLADVIQRRGVAEFSRAAKNVSGRAGARQLVHRVRKIPERSADGGAHVGSNLGTAHEHAPKSALKS